MIIIKNFEARLAIAIANIEILQHKTLPYKDAQTKRYEGITIATGREWKAEETLSYLFCQQQT